MTRIAINGLGRIGRCLLRILCENNYPNLELVSINTPSNIETLIHLLKYDSIHGKFNSKITFSNNVLFINDYKIKVSHEKEISNICWNDLKVDLVLETSGKFNKKSLSLKHIDSGAKKVIVSAPCIEADATIVFGVNHHLLQKNKYQVISVGSCTTNALAPLAKILHDAVGIEAGFMTTIHSYTNDQNLTDSSHDELRRSRAAALSMIPTSTGAAKAIGLVIPELEGKLGGAAVRVPTPNVSLIDLSFSANKDTSREEINQIISQSAQNNMQNIIDIAQDPLVSIDYNHNKFSAVFDPFETQVIKKRLVRIMAWYDNEWAFSWRMLDVTNLWSQIL